MAHRTIFSKFINDLNDNEISYVILRGFARLPVSPDSDIDLAVNPTDWEKFNKIAKKHLSVDPKEPFENYGFAEYCEMLYHPYFTPGPKDRTISNGCFRVDSYNSIYFSSPFNDFTSFWTIPNDLSQKIFLEKQNIKTSEYNFYIPKPEHEVLLLVLRSVLDVMGWKKKKCKQKHKDRIAEIITSCNMDELNDNLKGIFPQTDFVLNCIKNVQLELLYNKLIGDFNNGANRR